MPPPYIVPIVKKHKRRENQAVSKTAETEKTKIVNAVVVVEEKTIRKLPVIAVNLDGDHSFSTQIFVKQHC